MDRSAWLVRVSGARWGRSARTASCRRERTPAPRWAIECAATRFGSLLAPRDQVQLQMRRLARNQPNLLPQRFILAQRFGVLILQVLLPASEGQHLVVPGRNLREKELSVRRDPYFLELARAIRRWNEIKVRSRVG